MLPIAEFLPQISQSLSTSNNLVLQAEPGAGKSTALPLSLLDAPWLGGKKILMLEPRRVATKSIAHYLARQSGEPLGKRIGYQVKNDRKITRTTQLEIVTEGILTRRIQQDPELVDVDLIIFDEFHERSIHSDLALMLCLDIQQTLREDLKLLVMSATIDTRQIADYMGGTTVINCPGRAYPVSVSYTNPSRQPLERQITDSLRKVLADKTRGDTLVFLPGQAEIRRSIATAKEAFGDLPDVVFLPLYGALSITQQEQALVPDPDGKRRVVFTTNIAETSLTIEGVTCVIDSGLEKQLRYDPSSGMTRLETATISRASADQRQGRAGRTQPGRCIRLWDETKQRTLKEYQSEEIITAELTSLVLELISWGISDYDQVNWLTPAPKPHFDTAIATLQSLKLIDQDCRITALGRAAADFGLHPGLAAMLLQAENPTAQAIACELATLISERDIFSPNHGTDIVDRLWALQAYKQDKARALSQYPMRRATVEQLLTNARSLNKRLKANNAATTFSLTELQEHVGRLLLSAYPSRLAKRRTDRCGRYQMANGKGVFLFEDDPLFGSDWLVVADCDGQKKEGRIFSAAAITRANIEEQLKDQLVEEEVFSFDNNTQKISGKQLTKYQAITLHSAVIANIPPAKFQQCLQQVIKAQGLELLNWNDQCQQWLARAEWLAEQLDSFPKLSKQILIERIDDWLLPYIANVTTMAALKKVPLLELVKNTLSWHDQQLLEQQAPTQYTTPSNQTVPIVYDKQQGPTVSVILQELFGVTESPMLAKGRVALRFELLSPARRPIQTTSDLGNFWKSSYFEVAKEMRGRYPKHRWPDKPLLEKPGKSFKKR